MQYKDSDLLALRKALGDTIVDLRKRHDPPWTQFDLAMESGCRPEAISRIERGTVDFGVSKLFRIAAALDMKPADLLKELDSRRKKKR